MPGTIVSGIVNSGTLASFARRGDRRRGPPAALPAEGERRKQARRHARMTELIPLFRGIEEQAVAEALGECQVLSFSLRTVLLEAGQVNDCMYILLAGVMTVDIGTAAAPHPIPLTPGQSVGEMSIADKSPVSAQVVAEPGSRLLVIDEETFWSRVLTLPGVARNLFGAQAERLRRNNEKLIDKVRKEMQLEQIQRDLTVAAEIQLGMLPREFPLYPNCPQFDVFATMIPAREVGGDFYDAFLIDQDRLFFIIGDVSGKGVASALFMARAMTLFRTEASRNLPPHEILRRVNDQLARQNDNCMFVSVLCGVMNIHTGDIGYANGGHNPPLLGNQGGFKFIRVLEGPLIGVLEESDFASAQLRLWPGEMLVLYTDGVNEAENREGGQFGNDRLMRVLSAAGAANAQQTVTRLCEAIETFTQGEPQFDDITILAVKYRSDASVAVPWRDQWTTGIFAIDQEHRQLLGMVNQMEDMVASGGATGELSALAESFVCYCAEHFRTEEAHMAAIAYPRTAEHLQAHGAMMKALRGLADELAEAEAPDHRNAVLSRIRAVWVAHIEQEDSRLARHH